MSRLPNPGSDSGQWGGILNDFLLQAHQANGTLKNNIVHEATIANGSVSEVKLSAELLERLAVIEAKLNYTTREYQSFYGMQLPNQVYVNNGGNPLELATRLYTTVSGYVLGVRFYKDSENTGQHIGTLRTGDGTPIESVAFVNETAEGWQEQRFAEPVPITANTSYLVSYTSPTGNFSRSPGYFTSADVESNSIVGPRSSVEEPNGMYREGFGVPNTPGFQEAAYFVDIMFSPAP